MSSPRSCHPGRWMRDDPASRGARTASRVEIRQPGTIEAVVETGCRRPAQLVSDDAVGRARTIGGISSPRMVCSSASSDQSGSGGISEPARNPARRCGSRRLVPRGPGRCRSPSAGPVRRPRRTRSCPRCVARRIVEERVDRGGEADQAVKVERNAGVAGRDELAIRHGHHDRTAGQVAIAAVDDRHRVVVDAQALPRGSMEAELAEYRRVGRGRGRDGRGDWLGRGVRVQRVRWNGRRKRSWQRAAPSHDRGDERERGSKSRCANDDGHRLRSMTQKRLPSGSAMIT